MQRSSETIGAIAAALAKAQAELTNPEKSLIGDDPGVPSARERPDVSIRRAVERARHRAKVARRARDRDGPDDRDRQGGRTIRLTTMLAHSSGEWLSSEWPVCAISETARRGGWGRR